MHLLQAPESGWTPRTQICSGLSGHGIKELYDTMRDYMVFTKANNYFLEKRKNQQYELFLDSIEEQLKKKFYSNADVAESILKIKGMDNFQPFTEAKKILGRFLGNTD